MAGVRINEDANALTKIQQWPVVSDSWGRLTSFYSRTKESNRLVNFTMGTAEAGLKAAVSLATPVATSVLSKPMITINEVTCRQLDKLEHSYPIVTKPTNEVLDETKKKLEPIISRFHHVQKCGTDGAAVVKEKVQDTKDYVAMKRGASEHAVHENTLRLMNVMEFYVDKYLPPVEGETDSHQLDEAEKRVVLKRARVLGSKMQGRLSHYALKQLREAKTRSQDVVNSMYKVDLMEYARQNMDGAQDKMAAAKQRAQDLWTQHVPTSVQIRSAVGEERLKTLRTRLAEMRELSRNSVASVWHTTISYADSALAFVSMNKLTVTQVGVFASNFTAASVDTARIYGEMIKERALDIVGKKHEKVVIEMEPVGASAPASNAPADDALVKPSAPSADDDDSSPVKPAPLADDTPAPSPLAKVFVDEQSADQSSESDEKED